MMPRASLAGLEAPIQMDLHTGELRGEGVVDSRRTLGDLKGIFADETAQRALDPSTLVYRVQIFQPAESIAGALAWGSTFIEPGSVGGEYFMTKGHFHTQRDRCEFYVTVAGTGALILMDEQRRTRFEWMRPGTVHYIPGRTAHRVANTGTSVLGFIACWPSDAGHDYDTIAAHGFSSRLVEVSGVPTLVEARG